MDAGAKELPDSCEVMDQTAPSTSYFILPEQYETSEPGVDDDESQSSGYSTLTSSSALNTVKSINYPLLTHPDYYKEPKVNIYAEDQGPKLYDVKGNLVTPPILVKNLPEAFNFLPLFGGPITGNVKDFQNNKVREFVGYDLTDEEFDRLAQYCSPENLKTGKEFTMPTNYPMGLIPQETINKSTENVHKLDDLGYKLQILKKHKLRVSRDQGNVYQTKLKYRGVRTVPLTSQTSGQNIDKIEELLQPGKDIIFHVRVYRPFHYNPKEKKNNSRHSVFSCDVVLLGRQRLTALRDRFVCPNDIGIRADVSENLDDLPPASAKEVFPSGFLFINNVFYVDFREGCRDNSVRVREWAQRKGLGTFPHRDMAEVRLDELVLKLGHPEVYVHQGSCEHLFTFSEIRLLNVTDPLDISYYPYHTTVSHNQSVYCTTCAEFSAKWIVVGTSRIPFDPAFICDTCIKLYLYKDGKKIGDFKAYQYKGNEINVLKRGC